MASAAPALFWIPYGAPPPVLWGLVRLFSSRIPVSSLISSIQCWQRLEFWMGSAAWRRGVLGSIPEEEVRGEDAVLIWEATEAVRGTRWFSEVQMSSQRTPAPLVAFALALPAPVDRIRHFMPGWERRVRVLPHFDPSGSILTLTPLEMARAATLAAISQSEAKEEEVARRGSLLDLGGGGRSSGTPSDPEQRRVSEFRSPSEMGLGKALSSSVSKSGPRRKITFGEVLRSATDLRKPKQCSVAVGREEWLSRQLAAVLISGPVGRGAVELGKLMEEDRVVRPPEFPQ
jgi:hypothetical protein